MMIDQAVNSTADTVIRMSMRDRGLHLKSRISADPLRGLPGAVRRTAHAGPAGACRCCMALRSKTIGDPMSAARRADTASGQFDSPLRLLHTLNAPRLPTESRTVTSISQEPAREAAVDPPAPVGAAVAADVRRSSYSRFSGPAIRRGRFYCQPPPLIRSRALLAGAHAGLFLRATDQSATDSSVSPSSL